MNEYHIYGMKMITDYTFRQLVPFREDGKEYPVVHVLAGTAPEHIKECTNRKWEFGPSLSWLTNSTAWFVVENGESITYGELAREAARCLGKRAMSAQAIGGAVGRNPIPILIPCHRVLGSGSRLTCYSGGLDIKIRLLTHEGCPFR